MKKVLCFLLLWIFLTQIFAWIAFNRLHLFAPDKALPWATEASWRPQKLDFLGIRARWDSWWYMEVAASGYRYQTGVQSNIAFFPLYPVLMRYLARIFKSFLPTLLLETSLILSGTIISLLSLFVAVIFLYKLFKFDFPKEVAFRAIFYLLIFPTAILLTSVYPESLFLALSGLTFCFAREKRWFLAGSAGFFARSLGRLG